MAHECTGAFGHTREVVPPALGDDLVCFTCGSRIAPLLVFGDDAVDEAAEVSESRPDTVTPPPPPPPPPRQPHPPAAKQEARATPKRPVPKPGLTHFKEVRRLVRVEMLARIPGMNRAKARAVVERLPTNTMSSIMALSSGELAATPLGGGSRLGPELAQAVKKIVS